MLMPCATDAECPADHACVEHLACLQPFSDATYDPGEEEREQRGAGLPPPALLAEPPPWRKPRPTPITRYDAVNLCSAEVACAAPRACQPEKLCAPRGARALAYRGDNVTPARVARKTPAKSAVAPAPSASAPSPNEAPRPLESTAPTRGGCAGCAQAGGASAGGLGALGAALALLWRRRRRSAG